MEADFGDSKFIQMGRYLLMVAVIAAAPLAVLPAKYTWEALRYGVDKMSVKENIFVSVAMIFLCYTLALLLPNVGSVIAVTGATVNPFVGYILPILFYLRLDPEPERSRNKITAKIILLVVIIISITGFIVLF